MSLRNVILVLVTVLLAVLVYQYWVSSTKTSKALDELRRIPTVRISDLPFLLDNQRSEKLVFVRGTVKSISAIDGFDHSILEPTALFSTETGHPAVVVKKTKTIIYKERLTEEDFKKGGESQSSHPFNRNTISKSLRMVPFILTEEGVQRPYSDYVFVNLKGSNHDLPLQTVYYHKSPLFRHDGPAILLIEEEILPIGKVINAVGIYSLDDGFPEIAPCSYLPYFLANLTKDQMVADLTDDAQRSDPFGWVLGIGSGFLLAYIYILLKGAAAAATTYVSRNNCQRRR